MAASQQKGAVFDREKHAPKSNLGAWTPELSCSRSEHGVIFNSRRTKNIKITAQYILKIVITWFWIAENPKNLAYGVLSIFLNSLAR